MTDLVVATITRLQAIASQAGPLKHVAGLTSLAALTAPPIDKMTAAYVLDNGSSYSPQNGLINAVRQDGTESVRVALMIKSIKPQGVDAFNPIQAPRDAVIEQLLGWQPDAAFGQVLMRSTKLLDVQPTYLTYELVFTRQRLMSA